MAQVIASERGGKLLVFKGYSYDFRKNGLNKKIWACTQRRRQACLGYIHSAEEVPEYGGVVDVLFDSNNHNHTPDAASVEKKILNQVKQIASSSTDSTASVVATALEGASTASLGK